ncbi:MAG: hypothetical protein ACTS5I_00910 [Rhodanobacter sp.]
MDAEGIALISGLQAVLGAGVTSFAAGDIILGGDGSDTITGRMGDDIIDGDKWLNVRIAVHQNVGPNGGTGVVLEYHQSMTTLAAKMFSGEINPGQLRIHREITTASGNGDTDIAVFADIQENYTITANPDGSITVAHTTVSDGLESDGVDRISNIETLRFADGDLSLIKPVLDLHAFDVAGTYADNFTNPGYGNSTGATNWIPDWTETDDNNNVASGQIQITGGDLRFDDGNGATLTRTVPLAGAASARLTYAVEESGLDGGGDNDNIQLQFSSNGTNGWVTVDTINSTTGNATRNADLPGPFTATSAIRFVASSLEGGDIVDIGSIAIEFTAAAPADGLDFASSFTENGPNAPISNRPGITDDGATLASAKILLTNAQSGDALEWSTPLPAGISAVLDDSVEGQLSVNLAGTASLAAYQIAIQSVSFDNDSNNPTTVARIIEVTVNDGFVQSDPAITTVTVIAANDAPNAATDTLITNFTTGFVVPEWLMLLNDIDPEGSVLNVTNATENDAGFGITINAGDVTATRTDTDTTKDFTYTLSDGALTDTADVDIVWDTAGAITGGGAAEIFIGNNASSTFDAQGGNDTILAGDGADTIDAGTGDDRVLGEGGVDTIMWNANASGDTDGFDTVDGGLNVDTFDVNTRAGVAETYRVYTRNAAEAAGIVLLGATTEIVITRQSGATTSIIAELDNIEEIRIGTQTGDPTNGGAGGSPGDTVQIFGDFNETSLALNTITIDGNAGDDTIDISGLDSAHRIVFKSNGGNDTIVGTLRPQDVIELPAGTTAADYTSATVNGVTTLTSGENTISYTATGAGPQIGNDVEVDPPVVPGSGSPKVGTAQSDVLIGTAGKDDMVAFAGDDVVIGAGEADTILGGEGSDFINAGDGRDIVFAGTGDDTAFGGSDADLIYGEAGGDRIFGDAGDDMISGGAGDDTIFGGAGNDVIVAETGDGNDVYFGDEAGGGSGIDTLNMSAVSSAITVDLGNGGINAGYASSASSGTDTLWGFENVVTGSGADTITASNATNIIDGGAGNDTFKFASAAAANGDTIVGFQTGDRIDVSGIDANGGSAGSQAFALVTGSALTGPGQLLVTHESRADGEYTVVHGSVDADADAEFRINIAGTHNLTSTDFNL